MTCAIRVPGREGTREDRAPVPGADAGRPAPRITAKILAADLACLGHEVAVAVRSGADRVHVDVMEFGAGGVSVAPLVCRALRRVTRAPLEVHLLVKPAEPIVAAFARAGADLVVFHPEACEDVARTTAVVRGYGCAAGLAFAAGTPPAELDGLLGGVDVVVVTGAASAGQRAAPGALRWVRSLRARLSALRPELLLAVEGGIDAASGAALAAAGADVIVVESARCRAGDLAADIAALRRALRGGRTLAS